MKVLGIDIGGSGIKGAVVDTATGCMITERQRIDTPAPSTPAAVGKAIATMIRELKWKGPVGVGFPGIIIDQTVCSAANMDRKWLGERIDRLIGKTTGCPVHALNDADAAGVAEEAFGVGRGVGGTVLLLTLGTGIGSALFRDGVLVPNTEFGHMEFHGTTVEGYAAASVREKKELGWLRWGQRLNRVLLHLDFLLSPDLFILGGGVSSKFERYAPCLDKELRVVQARLKNAAGIIGAALGAARRPSQLSRGAVRKTRGRR